MDTLLAKLSEQQSLLAKQKSALSPALDPDKQQKEDSSSSSTLLTPASESFGLTSPGSEADGEATVKVNPTEMLRLKKELDDAKTQIARQKQELDQTRVIKHTFEQAMGPHSDAGEVTDPVNDFTASHRPFNTFKGYNSTENPDVSDSSNAQNPMANAWASAPRPVLNGNLQTESVWGQPNPAPRLWGQRGMGNVLPPMMMPSQPMQTRNYSVPISPIRGNGRNDFSQFNHGRGFAPSNRNSSLFQRGNTWDTYAPGPTQVEEMSAGGLTPGSAYPSMGMYPSTYQPRPIGTPLSPTATEFSAIGQASANPWNSSVGFSAMNP